MDQTIKENSFEAELKELQDDINKIIQERGAKDEVEFEVIENFPDEEGLKIFCKIALKPTHIDSGLPSRVVRVILDSIKWKCYRLHAKQRGILMVHLTLDRKVKQKV